MLFVQEREHQTIGNPREVTQLQQQLQLKEGDRESLAEQLQIKEEQLQINQDVLEMEREDKERERREKEREREEKERSQQELVRTTKTNCDSSQFK